MRRVLLSSSRLLQAPHPVLLRGALASPRPGTCRWLSTDAIDVPIPELGAESIVEGGILSLSKNVGDFVSAEEMVAEIETGTPHAGAGWGWHGGRWRARARQRPHALRTPYPPCRQTR